MSDVLVVKINCSITTKELETIHKNITKQMKTGLVLLPPGYDIYVVSQDCDVKVENRTCKDTIKKIPKGCSTCLHRDSLANEEPCISCYTCSKYEFKGCI